MLPSVEALTLVYGHLARLGFHAALGGSGLMHALGLVHHVRDWDLTLDADPRLLAFLLDEFEGVLIAPNSLYETAGMYRLTALGSSIDLMCRFAVRTTEGVCRLDPPSRGTWQGVALAAPETWFVAYRLLRRHERADTLQRWLTINGSDRDTVAGLLGQPIGERTRAEIAALPHRHLA